jgi:Uncharacterized conserved protein
VELNFKLDNFEGPLELLLHLVESKEMSIYEISISKIIDEYLILISNLTENNVQIKVEFFSNGSRAFRDKSSFYS